MSSITISLSPAQVARIASALQFCDEDPNMSSVFAGIKQWFKKIGSLEEFNLERLTENFLEASRAANQPNPEFDWTGRTIHGFCL